MNLIQPNMPASQPTQENGNEWPNWWEKGHASQLGEMNDQIGNLSNDLKERAINVKYPPLGLGLAQAKGDNTTDDYAALQAVLDYVATNGMPVYIPDGDYLTSKSLWVRNGSGVIFGAGRDITAIKKTTHTSFTASTVTISGTVYNVDDDSIINIEKDAAGFVLRDFTVYSNTYDGLTTNLDTNTTMTKYGIYGLSSNQFTIENVNSWGCNNAFYLLAPWKATIENCKAWRSNVAFFAGYYPGGASGTTTLFSNCYALTCMRGFSINGMTTTNLRQCSVDFANDISYNIVLSKNVSINECSAEQSGSVILWIESCQNFKGNNIRAFNPIARTPIYYKTAPIRVVASDGILENCTIGDYKNSDGSAYVTSALDLYNMSFHSSSNVPFNFKLNNCILPTNANAAYANGDTNALSSVSYGNMDGTQKLYRKIDNTFFTLSFVPSVDIGINYNGSITWDPASLANNTGQTSPDITVTGAALGDFVLVSAPYNLWDAVVTGYVSAANTVKIRIQNFSGVTVDYTSGLWKVRVMKS